MQNTNLREINIHIDYYCFPTETGDISVFTNLEQYTNSREKEYYERTLKEVNEAREKGKLILFDLQNKSFINERGEKVDIAGKVIFPRSTIGQADILMENIEKVRGKSITSRSDYETVENWFEVIKTKRNYEKTTMKELEANLNDFEKSFGEKFFIKTVHKGFSGICRVFELFPGEKYLFDSHFHSLNMTITKPETPILVYKKLEILKDDFGKREWRVFVVNNELLSLSRCSDDVVRVEEYVYEKVQEKIEEFKGLIPSSYVVDFFEYKEDNSTVFDVVEFNPIIASGTFANNHLVF